MNSTHDSYTPIGGAAPLVNIMLGEVDRRDGLRSLRHVAVRDPLGVHRRPHGRERRRSRQEDPGSRDEARRALHPVVPLVILVFTGISVVMQSSLNSLGNSGPHGLTEMTYAFTSQANNNGSAFGGLTGNTNWFNTTGGIRMLVAGSC